MELPCSSVYVCTVMISQSPIVGHLGVFSCYSASVNMLVLTLLYTSASISIGLIPRKLDCWVEGLFVHSLMDIATLLSQRLYLIYSHQQCMRVPVSSYLITHREKMVSSCSVNLCLLL